MNAFHFLSLHHYICRLNAVYTIRTEIEVILLCSRKWHCVYLRCCYFLCAFAIIIISIWYISALVPRARKRIYILRRQINKWFCHSNVCLVRRSPLELGDEKKNEMENQCSWRCALHGNRDRGHNNPARMPKIVRDNSLCFRRFFFALHFCGRCIEAEAINESNRFFVCSFSWFQLRPFFGFWFPYPMAVPIINCNDELMRFN